MLGKLIKQSETGKCLVIGTIMADRLIIKQQKISVWWSVKSQFDEQLEKLAFYEEQ